MQVLLACIEVVISFKLHHVKAKEAIGIEIIPWRPLGEKFGSLRREMDDLWRPFFGKTPLERRAGEEWWPTVDASAAYRPIR